MQAFGIVLSQLVLEWPHIQGLRFYEFNMFIEHLHVHLVDIEQKSSKIMGCLSKW